MIDTKNKSQVLTFLTVVLVAVTLIFIFTGQDFRLPSNAGKDAPSYDYENDYDKVVKWDIPVRFSPENDMDGLGQKSLAASVQADLAFALEFCNSAGKKIKLKDRFKIMLGRYKMYLALRGETVTVGKLVSFLQCIYCNFMQERCDPYDAWDAMKMAMKQNPGFTLILPESAPDCAKLENDCASLIAQLGLTTPTETVLHYLELSKEASDAWGAAKTAAGK